jgi:hypothetical protein
MELEKGAGLFAPTIDEPHWTVTFTDVDDPGAVTRVTFASETAAREYAAFKRGESQNFYGKTMTAREIARKHVEECFGSGSGLTLSRGIRDCMTSVCESAMTEREIARKHVEARLSYSGFVPAAMDAIVSVCQSAIREAVREALKTERLRLLPLYEDVLDVAEELRSNVCDPVYEIRK